MAATREEEQESRFDLLAHLPKELSLKIFTYLTGKELSVVCKVSKNWRDLANFNLLWKKLCIKESIGQDTEFITRESLEVKSELEPKCRWAQLYHEKMRLLSNWAEDKHIWLALDKQKPSVDVYQNILAVVHWTNDSPAVDIVDITKISLQQLQTLPLPFNIPREPVGVCINASVLTVEFSNISVIFVCNNGKFHYEISVIPDLQIVCPLGQEPEFIEKYQSDNRCWTLCLAGRYIWYQASSVVIIYDRTSKKFRKMDGILQVVAVELQGELIVVQCPHSIQVFYGDGKLLYTYCAHSNLFYTGLVMSSTSFAFLQSEDFSDPHVVQVELSTWQIYKETTLKVYRIALHKSMILLLSQEPFSLTSILQGETKWNNLIRGTKYLRPGKDFFSVICSRYVFVCPSLARLDMFSLFDVNNGQHLYDTSLNTSSYNIQTVSDYCLVVHSKKTTINIRSYV
uniref:F-box domain-containing protein n=2 Tax=Rhodnius prolixus TaxID=13249 RepID=T1HIR6_RHOPR